MKNTIAVLALSAFFTFTACKKSETTDQTTNVETKADQFSVDSVKVNDSIKLNDSLTIKYSSKMLVFPSIKDKKLLDSIYFGDKNVQDLRTDFRRFWKKIRMNTLIILKKIQKTGFPI